MSATNMPPPSLPPAEEYFVFEGTPLHCDVRAAVYQAGLAAGIAIFARDPSLLMLLFRDEERTRQIARMIAKRVYAELARLEVCSGIDDGEISSAITTFIEGIQQGETAKIMRKVASGSPPESGKNGKLLYPLNRSVHPLHQLGRKDQNLERKKVNRVKKGDHLVVRVPPEGGQEGQTVRGESIPVTGSVRDVRLSAVAGPNTELQGNKILSLRDGICREDARGVVRVATEMRVDEVNAQTGNLPKAGTATANFWIIKGVRQSRGVFTSEDVFVGDDKNRSSIDAQTSVHAKNLVVKGQISGSPLPQDYLRANMKMLSEEQQKDIKEQLKKSLVEIESTCIAREILNRNVSAESILIQQLCHQSSLSAHKDIWVDGHLIGGLVSFGRLLQVAGDLGNQEKTLTRIQLGARSWSEQKKDNLAAEIETSRSVVEEHTQALEEHQAEMEKKDQKSPYWKFLRQGEDRAPRGHTEQVILDTFMKAKKYQNHLREQIEDGQKTIKDLQSRIRAIDAGEDVDDLETDQMDVAVVVGGTIHPGVEIELTRPIEPGDLQRTTQRIQDGKQVESTLGELKNELTQQLNQHIELYQSGIEERKQNQEAIFKGRDQKPPPPEIPAKHFRVEFSLPEEANETDDLPARLPLKGRLSVSSHSPQTFFLKEVSVVEEPLDNAIILMEKTEEATIFRHKKNEQPLVSWQENEEILERLEEILVLNRSAHSLLFEQERYFCTTPRKGLI